MTRALVAGLVSLGCTSCLFLPGPEALKRIESQRPDVPYARVVFRTEPLEGEHSLAELRSTLEFWTARGVDGEPRWRSVLVPKPEDLYTQLLAAIDSGEADGMTLVSYKYDTAGTDDITLVDYVASGGRLVGYDHLDRITPPPRSSRGPFIGYEDMRWWEYALLVVDLPVYLAIGVKEFAGEILRSPISVLDNGWLGTAVEGRSPVSPVCFERAAAAFVEDWKDGFTALTWRFRTRRRHTPLDLTRELLGAVPIVGPVFDHKSPPGRTGAAPPTTVVALSQGIHAGSDSEQWMQSLEKGVRETFPAQRVVTLPYRYGGAFDSVWSLLNISSGTGYEAARELVFEHGVGPADGLVLIGFSGGAQRLVAATHALRHAGVHVNRMISVAGPISGFSCAVDNVVLLGDDTISDPVVLTAHAVDWFYFPIPSNFRRVTVKGGGVHRLPYFPKGDTREPESGYIQVLEAVLSENREEREERTP